MPASVAIRAASTLVPMPPSPTPAAAGPADDDVLEVGSRGHLGDEPAATPVGRPVVQAVDIGQQDQGIRADQVGHERGETVVVAEADLRGGHGVVLVDDRHDVELQQSLEGALGVAVVRPADQVVGGEQHLADGAIVAGEGVVVVRHEDPLADGGCSLRRRQVARTPAQAQRGDAGGDGPRGHQDELSAPMPGVAECVDELVDAGDVDPRRHAGKDGRAVARPGVDVRTGGRDCPGQGAHRRAPRRWCAAPPARSVNDDEPTLTTTRRAARIASRGDDG